MINSLTRPLLEEGKHDDKRANRLADKRGKSSSPLDEPTETPVQSVHPFLNRKDSDKCSSTIEHKNLPVCETGKAHLCSEVSPCYIGHPQDVDVGVQHETDTAVLVFGCGVWQKPKMVDEQSTVVANYSTVERNSKLLLLPVIRLFLSIGGDSEEKELAN